MIVHKLLGIDPGKTTGYCLIHLCEYESGRIIEPTSKFGNCKDRELISIKPILDEADIVCYEGWRTFSKKARSGALDQKEIYAEQAIGSMKTLLRLRTDPPQIHENLAGLKPVGYGYSNQIYVSGKKGMHWQDALAHAVYCAVDKYHWPPIAG